MSRFQTRRVIRDIGYRSRAMADQLAEMPLGGDRTDYDRAAADVRLKAALKRAVAKNDAPTYLIDAIRRRIRE